MSKFKSYKRFFKDVDKLGEFVCYNYSDDTKRAIIGDFETILKDETDEPLKYAIEDIIATAQLREVRVFPNTEFMYVRADVKLLDAAGEFGEICQLLALYDCFNVLKSYTLILGEKHCAELPTFVSDSETAAQKDVRANLHAKRTAGNT